MSPKSSARRLVRYAECPNKGHYLLFPVDASPEPVDAVRCKGCGRKVVIEEISLGLVHQNDAAVGLSYKEPQADPAELDFFLAAV